MSLFDGKKVDNLRTFHLIKTIEPIDGCYCYCKLTLFLLSLCLDLNGLAGHVCKGRAHGDQILVQGDGLVQPLPGLVQGVDAVSNTNTVTTAVKGHSFQLADRRRR